MAVSLERASDFVYRNARLLERALFANAFEGGPADAVRSALLAYRNPDGGFGHALEPDVRAPGSTPLFCELALHALRGAGLRDPAIEHGICEFLASVAEPAGAVPIVLPSVLSYPRANHWQQPNLAGHMNPTGSLVGLLRAQGADHPWLDRAEAWCWQRIEQPIEEAHELLSAFTFLDLAPDRERAQKLVQAVASQVEQTSWYISDPADTSYGVTPVALCPSPDSLARTHFAPDLLDAHLDALAARQQDDGGWPINFQAPSEAAAYEWRGKWTLDALLTLRAWQRL